MGASPPKPNPGYALVTTHLEYFQSIFSARNGSLACRCPRGYFGTACERQTGAVSGGGPSFTAFLLLAVIPLSLAVGAGILGLLCKMCCCDCFGGCPFDWLSGRDEEDPLAKDDLWDTDGDPYRENAFNRSLETSTATTSAAGSEKSSLRGPSCSVLAVQVRPRRIRRD